MNETVIRDVAARIREIARENDIALDRIIVYGSQARGDHTGRSDIDMILVSSDWEDVDYYARPERFLIEWPRDRLPDPDIIPLTPDELRERERDESSHVRTALDAGVAIEAV